VIKLMKLDGNTVLLEPRTITRAEREGSITRVSAGLGRDVLVMETPDEIEAKINADALGAGEATGR